MRKNHSSETQARRNAAAVEARAALKAKAEEALAYAVLVAAARSTLTPSK